MDIKQIADGVAVAGQIGVEDVAKLAALGYRTLISNRPDSEAGAVPHEQIRAAAEAAGMTFHYIPVISGSVTDADVSAMAAAVRDAEQPVLAYCRSGTRSAALYRQAIDAS